MPLPKIHPMRKTYVDLRRCAARLDEFLAQFDPEDTNEEVYIDIYESIKELMEKIPEEFK
jgi:Fe-S-cluster formation regulator IscX/YfhJ